MSKPTLSSGFVGGQPKLGDVKLKTDSHKDSEFRVIGNNYVHITFSTGQATKVVTKLTECATDTELPEYVLVQRKDHDKIHFHVAFRGNGYYTLMIFALPESDSNESLPNVYNYLINVERNSKPACPFVKAYTKFFKDNCFLDEPKYLNPKDPHLDRTKFDLVVPGAHKVAVHCKDEWFQLEKKGGNKWEGKVDFLKFKGQNVKITVNGCYDEKGSSYSVLLEYALP